MTDEEETTTPATTPAEVTDAPDAPATEDTADGAARGDTQLSRALAYGLLPALILLLALGAGGLKYWSSTFRDDDVARAESTQAAKDGTVAILSYSPDKVEQQLNDARNLLSGDFAGQYLDLINNVVIPGAKQKQISAVATVPAVGSVSADRAHAVVLVFVNQTVVVGADAPTDTASTVRVTLDRVDDKWLISAFEPV